ncbi:response regulator transcription factor [Ornithinimicrobium sufpigmenti]|uniref:response regulator transcription factor n=1 Tax=Ornithinimicrobium sufpigmenti TaxID=2508882 RepID=UPI0015E178D8|nr:MULTISPECIES: response regulator transcription factor [unclassified Ornithinimicrobium]
MPDLSFTRRLRVGLITDSEIVRDGVRALLAPHTARVTLVEPAGPAAPAWDVALLDAWSPDIVDQAALRKAARDPRIRRVVLYTSSHPATLPPFTASRPARLSLPKQLNGAQLVQALEELCGGPAPRTTTVDRAEPAHGLTRRQAEIIGLITTGLTNEEIIERTGLSKNTVKTYIRAAYGRIGVDSRARAVRWGMENGFLTSPGSPSTVPSQAARPFPVATAKSRPDPSTQAPSEPGQLSTS